MHALRYYVNLNFDYRELKIHIQAADILTCYKKYVLEFHQMHVMSFYTIKTGVPFGYVNN